MANIKNYEPILIVYLDNWKVIYTKWDIKKITDYLEKHKFILIENKSIAVRTIRYIEEQNLDNLDQFILAQKEEIRNKLLEKKKRLKDNMGKEMSIKYAQNLVKQYLENNK